MELGTGLMGLPMPTMRGFNSKAEAIQFAIEFTASSYMGGRKVELEAAKELFDFICKNVLTRVIKGDGSVVYQVDRRASYEWVNLCHYDKVTHWMRIKFNEE